MRYVCLLLMLFCMTGCTGEDKPPREAETTPLVSPIPSALPSPTPTILSTYTTKILDKDPERVINIKLALKSIDGVTLASGQSFSFNKTVGERTSERGYKKALAIVDDHKEEVEGGGICQVSSTLYNAVEKAGLTVVERNKHTKKVNYVPEGRDAAVSYGQMDFRFVNSLKETVQIRGSVNQNTLTMTVVKLP